MKKDSFVYSATAFDLDCKSVANNIFKFLYFPQILNRIFWLIHVHVRSKWSKYMPVSCEALSLVFISQENPRWSGILRFPAFPRFCRLMKTRNRRYPWSSGMDGDKSGESGAFLFSRRVPDFCDGRRWFLINEKSNLHCRGSRLWISLITNPLHCWGTDLWRLSDTLAKSGTVSKK